MLRDKLKQVSVEIILSLLALFVSIATRIRHITKLTFFFSKPWLRLQQTTTYESLIQSAVQAAVNCQQMTQEFEEDALLRF